MAAARNPARRAALAVALLAASAGCSTPAPRAIPSPSVSPGWRAVTELRAYAVHAALGVDGGVMLAGERTGSGGGVLLRYDGVLKELDAPADAAQIRAMTRTDAGELVLGGIDTSGRGVVLVGSPGTWSPIPVPAEVTQIDAVALAGSTIVAAGSAGDHGIVLAGSKRGLTVRVSVPPAAGRFARLTTIAFTEARLIAGGTNGDHALIASSIDGGHSFRLDRVNGVAVTAVVASGDTFLAGGYAGASEASRSGFLLRSRGGGWQTAMIPACASVLALTRQGTRVLGAIATGGGDELIASSDGGVTWRVLELAPTSQPPTVEALAWAGDDAWAAGASGLYRGPV